MACYNKAFLVSVVLIILEAAAHDTANFPLRDCDTGQFDILVLHTTGHTTTIFNEHLPADVAQVWEQDEETQSRAHVSIAIDTSIDFGKSCHIEMIRFDETVLDVCSMFPDLTSIKLNSSSLLAEIEQKIKISASIFSDTDLARRNSTLVAVLIFDSVIFPSLTIDDIKRIPDILSGHSSDIRLLVMVHEFGENVEPIFLRDTLIFGIILQIPQIYLALCNQCPRGWFRRGIEEPGDFLSCYKLQVSNITNWSDSLAHCYSMNGFLATIESKEELQFLQEHLFLYILENRQRVYNFADSGDESVTVYIGLNRDSANVAKRFQWMLEKPVRYRPLVLNHWLPGSPAGGFSQSCGAWFYSGILNFTIPTNFSFENISAGKLLFAEYLSQQEEGWMSVGCGIPVSGIKLCEVTLSHHFKAPNPFRIYPANKNSVHRALNRSGFREYEGNIVSVAAYANNEPFLRFLKDKNEDFPMFDCGDDKQQPRYVSFPFVSDFAIHCSNGQDESLRYVTPCHNCQCIPLEAVCDNVKDCEDGSDEKNCESCRGRMCCDGTCLPSQLFNDGEIDCSQCLLTGYSYVNDESHFLLEYSHRKEMCAFMCNLDQCIYPSQLNDSKLDCTGPEGHLDETIGKLERTSSCSDKLGVSIWAPRCVYLKDRYGSCLGCRDLSHLQSCRDFNCSDGYYKCPGTYCIPLHYILDGQNDCPYGEDEVRTLGVNCTGNFACWNSSVCLHPDLVCDGAAQCPQRDDELHCYVTCPPGLRCVAGTVTVDSKQSLSHLRDLNFINDQTRYLDLSGVDLSNTHTLLNTFVRVLFVRFSGCQIRDLYNNLPIAYCCMSSVYALDLSYNLISSINGDKLTFDLGMNLRLLNFSFNTNLDEFINLRLPSLTTLDLSYTGLYDIDERSFQGLQNMKNLNLSHTKLSTFHKHVFPSVFTLQVLDLRGAPIAYFNENMYNGLVIKSSLYTDNFAMCCPSVRGSSIPEHTCHSSEDPISSCLDLIKVDVQRILLWLMAGMALLGNVAVILNSLIWNRNVLKKAHNLFVLNLGISDLIMGLYLFMIVVADVYYRGVYVLHDMYWKESIYCKVAGFLVILSSETSTLFVLLITVGKILSLTFFKSQKQFSKMINIVIVSVCWCFSFMVAMIPVLNLFGSESIFSFTAVCNGLILSSQNISGWEYSLSIFICLNFSIYFVIFLGQLWIFRFISENSKPDGAAGQNTSVSEQNITLVKQLSLVVLSNCIRWLSVGVIGFLSVSGHEISNDVYAWTVVVVIPVTSAIDPLVYIFPILINKWEQFKFGQSQRR